MIGGMTFHLHTYGCQMNVRDSEAVEALLSAAGHVRVENESDAENVTVKAAEWFHEGVRQHYAVYTAANSGGHVTGGGTLVVGKGGTLVIFR